MGDKTFQANVAIFQDRTTVQNIVLPDGCRFVFLQRGHAPDLVDICDPGEYEVDTPWVADDQIFHVAIAVIDLAHVPAWLALGAKTVSLMMDRIDRELASRTPSE